MTKTEQEKNFEMQSLEVSSTDLMVPFVSFVFSKLLFDCFEPNCFQKQVEVLQAEVQTAQKKCTLLQQELASANHTKQVLEERIKATEKLINDFTEKETEMRSLFFLPFSNLLQKETTANVQGPSRNYIKRMRNSFNSC